MMPECVVLQQALEMVIMDHRVGPRSNQRHIPAQNVDKLGQLVDARSAKKCANSCHTRVIARRLRDRISIFLHAHRSELEHHKLAAIEPFSILEKEDRTLSIEPNGQGRDRHDWTEK